MLTRSEKAEMVTAGGAGPTIEVHSVTKCYKLYPSVSHQAMDLLGFYSLMPWWRPDFPEFRALNRVNITIERGERVGVIGRNGAGKTTLLKIITGSTEPTEGRIRVGGNVQALMQVGVGFHPEFTGYENIRASLQYTALHEAERKEAEEDIIDFCELGDFLFQPLKTYSLGMQSRLQFACATAIKPEILIVDEILGAGDGYFSAKSAQRMEKLTKSGCTLLLVSHSMGQILQFCDKALWLEGGQIMARGDSREIVNRYEKFIHELRREAKITESEQLAKAKQSEWLREKTLRALRASRMVVEGPEAGENAAQETTRWSQDGSPIEISAVRILDENDRECDFFAVGEPMVFEIQITALRAGEFPCRYCIVLFTSDGRLVVRHVSGWFQHNLEADEHRTVKLRYDASLLGTGNYFFSVAAYERLNLRNMNEYRWYDLHARAYDFRIAEDAVDPVSLVHHPGRWMLVDAPAAETERRIGIDYSVSSKKPDTKGGVT